MRKNFIIILLIASNILDVFSQPCTNIEELTRKRHQIGGSTQGHPYTMFDRHNGLSFDSTIKNIRHRIWKEYDPINSKHGPVYLAYQNVCDNANLPMPTDNGMDVNAVSSLAVWAKNNAFVFLIGLDRDGNFMDSTAYSGVTNFDKRNEYRNKSLYAFDVGLTGAIDANNPSWGWWIFPTAYLFANWIEEQNFLNKLQFHSRSLLFWLQSYDLMKAAYELPELRDSLRNPFGFADADRNGLACTPRNKLRKLTRDLYQESQGARGVI
jgi:hypothetical protein